MKTNIQSQKGQMVVIFALALTALLAFTALAIDGGMIFADRRQSQGSADSASLAGAGAAANYMEANGVTYDNFSCTSTKVMTAITNAYNSALNRATVNQLSGMDNDLSDNHGIEVVCVNDDAKFDKHIDIHTRVTTTVSTSFVQLFFSGTFRNTVNALTRIHPRTALVYGRAIVSLSDECANNDGGVVFDGNNTVHINGGGVFSNSCIKASGSVNVAVGGGGISRVGDLTVNGGAALSPGPTQTSVKMPRQIIPTPGCLANAAVDHSGGGTISPGNYSKIKLTNGNTLVLQPGLYCLSGDMDIQGGEINGDGVTIYITGSNNNMLINGGATAHLNAAPLGSAVNGAIVGVLVYMQEGNTGNASLLGNAGSSFVGAIYVPDGSIDVGGTSGVNPTYNTQLIGKFVKVHGNAEININYVTSPLWQEEPKLNMLD